MLASKFLNVEVVVWEANGFSDMLLCLEMCPDAPPDLSFPLFSPNLEHIVLTFQLLTLNMISEENSHQICFQQHLDVSTTNIFSDNLSLFVFLVFPQMEIHSARASMIGQSVMCLGQSTAEFII